MRTTVAYIVVCLTFALGIGTIAAQIPPAPPSAPPPPGAPALRSRVAPNGVPGVPGAPASALEHRVRSIAVGPADSVGVPRRVRGQILVTAILPTGTQTVSVELFCNNALLGQKSQSPYQAEFNSETVTDGPQTLKAVGLDANGKQVWTAITRIDVQNQRTTIPTAAPPAPGAVKEPIGPAPAKKPTPAVLPTAPIATKKPTAPAVKTDNSGLGNRFMSAKHEFSVRYPAGWSVSDKTSEMKPRRPGNIWVQFAPAKTANLKLIVNVRRMRLAPGTSADMFAKFNPYVGTWERKTALGSPAFATTTTVSPAEVIHRLIIIKGGSAWMLNCIDTSGTPADSTKALFESVAGSLALGGSVPSKTVTVKEIKKH